jgi:hypothetical protein
VFFENRKCEVNFLAFCVVAAFFLVGGCGRFGGTDCFLFLLQDVGGAETSVIYVVIKHKVIIQILPFSKNQICYQEDI